MLIIADIREPRELLTSLRSRNELSVEVDALDVGDYVIGPGVVVERKTGEDFVSSILDGRLADCSARMIATYRRIICIIEGSPYVGRWRRCASGWKATRPTSAGRST